MSSLFRKGAPPGCLRVHTKEGPRHRHGLAVGGAVCAWLAVATSPAVPAGPDLRLQAEPGASAATSRTPSTLPLEPISPRDCDLAWMEYVWCRLSGKKDCIEPDC